nr:MAG TPA: Holliday junction resolvasome, endonuclease subunit [Caudoviricetes sp.]
MLVVGIDGSTNSTGISVIQDGNLKFYSLIDLHKEKNVMKRIQNMLLKICEILDQYNIDAIYMEKSVLKSNVDTVQKLANLAGGIMLYCAKNNIEFNHPLPSEWRAKIGIKQSSKIKREVLKEEAIFVVKNEYGIDVNDDIAESILIARSAFNLPKVNISEDDLWE